MGMILCNCTALGQPVIVKSAFDRDEKKLSIPKVEIDLLLNVFLCYKLYNNILVVIPCNIPS